MTKLWNRLFANDKFTVFRIIFDLCKFCPVMAEPGYRIFQIKIMACILGFLKKMGEAAILGGELS